MISMDQATLRGCVSVRPCAVLPRGCGVFRGPFCLVATPAVARGRTRGMDLEASAPDRKSQPCTAHHCPRTRRTHDHMQRRAGGQRHWFPGCCTIAGSSGGAGGPVANSPEPNGQTGAVHQRLIAVPLRPLPIYTRPPGSDATPPSPASFPVPPAQALPACVQAHVPLDPRATVAGVTSRSCGMSEGGIVNGKDGG